MLFRVGKRDPLNFRLLLLYFRRATANTTLNQNLELFSLYLDTLMLDQSFIWVSIAPF
jgi:hypothetical protein